MSEHDKARDETEGPEDATLLPAREVMSLLTPGTSGIGGLLGGTGVAPGADPSAALGGAAPAGTVPDAGSTAAHAQDLAAHQPSDHPTVSDQPQTLAPSSDKTASSQT